MIAPKNYFCNLDLQDNITGLQNCRDNSELLLPQSSQLPGYAKYLLIAAYLASYNAAKEDKRLFVQHHGKRKKRVQDAKNKAKVCMIK